MMNMTVKIKIPPFACPVICANTPTRKVPKKDAPLPQISYKPKYSPLFSAGMIFAK